MESINERIKMLRNKCGKSQTEFGKALGITASGVSDIESGRRKVTEQHIIMLQNWKEFSINTEWLRTGEGGDENMFLKPQKNDLVAKAALLLGEHDPIFEALVETYSKLNPVNRKAFVDFGTDFLEILKKYTKS